jgi:dipeptidyl aminopeptidase/acylaminoacyl peptidase
MKSEALVKFVAVALSLVVSICSADPVPLTGLDIASMNSVSGITLSPDGNRVAYVLTMSSFDENAKYAEDDLKAGWTVEDQVWMVDVGADAARQLTFGEEKSSLPLFSPDGSRLAFLRKENKHMQLHVLDLGGGEAKIVPTGNHEPQTYAWSPDGQQFAFIAEAPLTDAEKHSNWGNGGAINWEDRWRNTYLWTVPVEGGEPRQVTTDDMNIVSFAWSPDGKQFLTSTSESSDPYYAYSLMTPRLLSAADGSVLKTLLEEPAALGEMAWSPDGRLVAFEYADGGLSLLNSLMVHEVESDKSWNATASLDPTLSGFFFTADSKSLIAHLIERTDSSLYRLSVDGKRARLIGQPGRVFSGPLVPSRDRRYFAAISSTTDQPPDPTVIEVKGLNIQIVAKVNPQVEAWKLGVQEVVSWQSPEGVTIEGVLFRSPLSREGVAGPLLVLPHGGPDSVTTRSFSSWAHYFASRGLSVLRPNYRGGLGYGFDFYAANRGRLGVIEFMDIEAGVDHLVAEGIANPDQLFYGGWSWGGYLTTWTIGHTNRYQAAVAGAAVVDTVNQYVTSDINHGAAAEWEYTGTPWKNFEIFDNANPMRFLYQAETPTLIIHGQSDDRVPFPQGLTLYRALSDSGVEVEMYAYPREPHGFEEPAHSRHMLEAWMAWYESHGLQTSTQ